MYVVTSGHLPCIMYSALTITPGRESVSHQWAEQEAFKTLAFGKGAVIFPPADLVVVGISAHLM